jgi:hypothetical protein
MTTSAADTLVSCLAKHRGTAHTFRSADARRYLPFETLEHEGNDARKRHRLATGRQIALIISDPAEFVASHSVVRARAVPIYPRASFRLKTPSRAVSHIVDSRRKAAATTEHKAITRMFPQRRTPPGCVRSKS